MSPKTRRLLLNLARVAISAGLLAWVITRAGPGQLAQVIRTIDLRLYALAISLSLIGIVVRAYRWLTLLNAVGARLSFRRTLYLYFVGAFFNAFLPTGFGGDVVRVLEVGPGATSEQAAGTALVDRLTGFIVLFVLALTALPFSARLLPPSLALLIAALAGGVALGSALLFEGRLLRRVTARFPRALSLAGEAWLGKTYSVITACGRKALLGALFWSLVFNLIQIWANVLVARALGIGVSEWMFFLVVPVATAALLLPTTISGLGVREAIFVTVFGQVGVSAARATALSFGSYSLDLAAGAVGGLIYLGKGLLDLRQ